MSDYSADDLKQAERCVLEAWMNYAKIPLDIQCGAKINGDVVEYVVGGAMKIKQKITSAMIKSLVEEVDDKGINIRNMALFCETSIKMACGEIEYENEISWHDIKSLIFTELPDLIMAFARTYGGA